MNKEAFLVGFAEKQAGLFSLNKKQPTTQSKHYFVDKTCIDCDLCREIAPSNFKRNADIGESYVAKQPSNEQEKMLCARALNHCPVQAIKTKK